MSQSGAYTGLLSLSRLISLRRHSPIVVEACSAPRIGRSFWRAEPPGAALLLLSLARSFCLRQLEWMVGRKQESRTLRGGTVYSRDGQSLPIIPLEVPQSFPRNCFSTTAAFQTFVESSPRSCNAHFAVRHQPLLLPLLHINHTRISLRSISLGATLTWCFITRTTIIELSCGLPSTPCSAKQTTDLLLCCPSLYSGVSLYRKRHEYTERETFEWLLRWISL